MARSTKKTASVAETSTEDLSTALPIAPKRKRRTKEERESARAARNESPAGRGMPGSVNDSRRCSATAHRTGERCKAAAIIGGKTCRVHGGAAPQVKKSAKERLLELADPALAALSEIVQDEKVEDAVRLRASLGILDRIGLGPGQTLTVQSSPWDDLIGEISASHIELDRSLDGPQEYDALPGGVGAEDVEQAVYDAQSLIDRSRHDAEGREYESGRIRPDTNTIRGEVVEDSWPLPPEPGPGAMQEMGGEAYPRRGESTDREPDDPPAYDGP